MQCNHYCLRVAFDSNLELILLGQIFSKHFFVVETVVQYVQWPNGDGENFNPKEITKCILWPIAAIEAYFADVFANEILFRESKGHSDIAPVSSSQHILRATFGNVILLVVFISLFLHAPCHSHILNTLCTKKWATHKEKQRCELFCT